MHWTWNSGELDVPDLWAGTDARDALEHAFDPPHADVGHVRIHVTPMNDAATGPCWGILPAVEVRGPSAP